MNGDGSRLTAWIDSHARALLLVSFVITVASAPSLFRLRLDLDVLDMLPRDAPVFDNLKSFVADFDELNELFILVEGSGQGQLEEFAGALTARQQPIEGVVGADSRIGEDGLPSLNRDVVRG